MPRGSLPFQLGGGGDSSCLGCGEDGIPGTALLRMPLCVNFWSLMKSMQVLSCALSQKKRGGKGNPKRELLGYDCESSGRGARAGRTPPLRAGGKAPRGSSWGPRRRGRARGSSAPGPAPPQGRGGSGVSLHPSSTPAQIPGRSKPSCISCFKQKSYKYPEIIWEVAKRSSGALLGGVPWGARCHLDDELRRSGRGGVVVWHQTRQREWQVQAAAGENTD